MAVKGRLRFEILRRDNHQCRYCGATAPDARLTVDHVVPESLGGSDDPTNLVTACTSCNAGKASIAPDSSTVEDVAADALRYSKALTLAIQQRSRDFDSLRERLEEFDSAWCRWGTGSGEDRQLVPRSADWANTVERWLIGGLSVDELVHKIPLAMARKVKRGEEWRFFCGIGWNMLTELQDQARGFDALGGDEQPVPVINGLWSCETCGANDPPSVCAPCAYEEGWQEAVDRWRMYQDSDASEARRREIVLGAVLV